MIAFTIIYGTGNTDTLKSSRTKLTVGGAYTDDITLLGRNVSPEHGIFRIDGNQVAYTDSGFGTLVNDREVVGETVPLTPDDAVRIGEFVITHAFDSDGASPTVDDLSSSLPRVTGKTPSRRPEPTRPDLPVFSTPEEKHTRTRSSDSAPPRTSPAPTAPPSRPLPDFKQIRIPEPKKQEITQSSLAIFVIFLMVFFWPLGFLANIIAWKYLNKDAHNKEGQTDSFGCVGSLLAFNVIILVISLLVIGILVFTAVNQ
jgi:hypothetical protein